MCHFFNKMIMFCVMLKNVRGCPRGVMVKAMDCGIVVREFVLQSFTITFTFGQIPLGKV